MENGQNSEAQGSVVLTGPIPPLEVFEHGVTQEQIELLECNFSKLTPEGWLVPEWIDLLRKPLNKTLYG